MRRLSIVTKGIATQCCSSSEIWATLDWFSIDIDSFFSAMPINSDNFSTSIDSYYRIPRAALIYFRLIGQPLLKIAFPKIYFKALRFFLMSSCFYCLLLFWLAFFFWKYSGTGSFKFSLMIGYLSFFTSSRYFSINWQASAL